MNRGIILLLGVVAQIVLTALFVWRVVPSIARDIDRRSELALSASRLNWAQVEVDGRTVTLTGLAPSEKQQQRALEALRGVSGIRRVDDQTRLVRGAPRTAPATEVVASLPVPDVEQVRKAADQNVDITSLGLGYVFRVERQREQVVLMGMVPDEPSRTRLLDTARAKFENLAVVDELLLNDDAPPDFMRAAAQSISIAGLVTSGATGVRDRTVFVEGLTASDRDLQQLRDTIIDALPDGYATQLQVGSRQTLSAIMRENPDLARRVGDLPDQDPDTGRIDLGIRPALDRSPEAAIRCQTDINARLSSERITFDTGKSDISAASARLMDDLVALVKACPQARIEIAGHTDDQGTEQDNLQLSQRRAESVMEHFVRNGVKLGRLSAVGYGEGQPLVENRTAADRARNRRIEFRVL